jgi:hypothetical protein
MTVATTLVEESQNIDNVSNVTNVSNVNVQNRSVKKLIFSFPSHPKLFKRSIVLLSILQLWNVWQAPLWTLFVEFLYYVLVYLELTITLTFTNAAWLEICELMYATQILKFVGFGISFGIFLTNLLSWQYSSMLFWLLMCCNMYQGFFAVETLEINV